MRSVAVGINAFIVCGCPGMKIVPSLPDARNHADWPPGKVIPDTGVAEKLNALPGSCVRPVKPPNVPDEPYIVTDVVAAEAGAVSGGLAATVLAASNNPDPSTTNKRLTMSLPP
jgi:hypothetical protein